MLALLCGVLGLVVGSFLNVVIYRVPRKESVMRPPSHCPRCDRQITPRDNIPVVSWLLLRGRCRGCGLPISARYPLVELATAGLFVAMAFRFSEDWALPAFLVLAATCLAGSAIDLEHMLLPNRLVFPALALATPLLLLAAAIDGSWWRFVHALIGAVGASGALLLLAILWPRGNAMGGGDIKLALLLGLCLGWLGGGHVALGLFLGFLLGSVAGVALVVTKARALQAHFAFGPFLAAGTLITVWWGTQLLDWYTGVGRG
jgi:leader peptidase (prepilin peptidase)/N-methyltransferase